MLRRRAAVALALVGGALLSAPASAFDFKVNKEPLRLDLTESMYLSAHLDDGNPDPTTKNYGEMVNRLNAQLAWRKFLFSVRFDSGAWVHTPQPGDHSPYVSPKGSVPELNCPAAPATNYTCVVQPDDPRLKPDPDPDAKPGTTLRFRDGLAPVKRGPIPIGMSAFYLEKFAISYTDRSFDATLGDFYVSLGRGLVLSIRKLDELGTDTSVTGGKFAFRVKDKNVDLSGVALAGFTNVQNFDQARAQYIPDPNDFVSAVHFDARLFDRVLVGAHVMFGKPACPYGQTCDDKTFGDKMYLRPGVMVDAPKLTKWLGVYAEYARRQDRDKDGDKIGDKTGDAVYAAANIYAGRTAWLLEFKHYDHYLPWHAANDPFGSIVYQQPPTLERITTQISNNTDITAGRLRLDVRVNPSLSVYWSGEYAQAHLSEVVATTLVDIYAGAEARWNEGHSHLFPVLGFRNERKNPNHEAGVEPETEEQLWSVQWDGTQVLGKRLALETQGVVWFRRKGLESVAGSGDNEWREGNVYLSLKWAPKLVLSGGYEFTTIAKEQANKHHFFNGQILWNITSGTSLALFVGGNRPGLKCVSGVCRDFPAFEGVRLEFVLRI